MIQSTGKIRPILEVKDHFTVVSVVCEVSFAFPPFLWTVIKGAKTSRGFSSWAELRDCVVSFNRRPSRLRRFLIEGGDGVFDDPELHGGVRSRG